MYTKIYKIILFALLLVIPACAGARISQEQCIKNQSLKLAVFTFQNDVYGATDTVAYNLHQACYQIIERSQIANVISEINFQASGMTESQQLHIGSILNVDYIVTGSAFTVSQSYQQNPYANANAFSAVIDGLARGMAGTYLRANVRFINVRTGRVDAIENNINLRKIAN